ncbi:NAD-dependent epimerase/dehydratase family protein, partial [bacterium]|nr:NAD-dependent epimerase/dehydratase family protein [bacterium]
MTAVLVTGGAGFIGANFVKSRILDRWDSRSVVVLDALTYAGNKSHLEEVEDRITFVQGDIADLAVVRDVFDRYKID